MKKLLAVLILAAATMNAQYSVHYSLAMPEPWTHFFDVTMRIDGNSAAAVDLHMPAWRTGRYVILDFSGTVQEVSARDGEGMILPVRKTDRNTWQVAARGTKTVLVSYRVYANEPNMRTRELNGSHGFVDPAAVFMYVEELKDHPLHLTVRPYGEWHVTTGLEAVTGSPNTFTAPSYEYFIDCPLEIGLQKDFPFTVDGTPHVLSINGEGNWNSDTLIRDISAIVSASKKFWGRFPYDRFVFILHCQPNAGGGTEHINSTVMGIRPFVFVDHDRYQRFLGLVAHEFFHTWNVKQIRPKSMAPYDLSREAYTRELWISEGATDYYKNIILRSAGLRSADDVLRDVARMIASDRRRPGNAVQPLSESSFDAWVKYWKGHENAYLSESDYYDKGAAVSLLLDLELRHRTHNASSLDDIMRRMFERFSPVHGFTNDDFIALCSDVAGSSMKKFFDDYLFGTVPLPWEQVLGHAGLTVTQRDSDGTAGLGIVTDKRGGAIRLAGIVPHSPAEEARLEVNDELIAMDGFRVRPDEFEARLADLTSGTTVRLTVFRNDKLMDVPVTLRTLPSYSFIVEKKKGAPPLEQSIFGSWLRSPF